MLLLLIVDNYIFNTWINWLEDESIDFGIWIGSLRKVENQVISLHIGGFGI